ncbi:MAG: hypothetical protein AB9891_11165 [Anaerolineaceae bacterium]
MDWIDTLVYSFSLLCQQRYGSNFRVEIRSTGGLGGVPVFCDRTDQSFLWMDAGYQVLKKE